LDFVVEYRAGSKIDRADALSLHVGAVTYPGNMSKEKSYKNKEKMLSTAYKSPGFITRILDNNDLMYRH
jgi:hypothetical protein